MVGVVTRHQMTVIAGIVVARDLVVECPDDLTLEVGYILLYIYFNDFFTYLQSSV